MAVPDYQSLMLPLLSVAADQQEHSSAEVLEVLASQLGLTLLDRDQMLPSGRQAVFYNRVNWARTYLKHAGLIQSTGRSTFRITPLGLQVLDGNPPRIDNTVLRRYPSFVQFQSGKLRQENQTATADVRKPEHPARDAEPDLRLNSPRNGPRSVARSTRSFADAAQQVLERFGTNGPMHYREITQKALELGLVQTAGQTPEQTLYAQISTEIARDKKRGDAPRFIKHGRGLLGVFKRQQAGLAFQIEHHNASIRQKLHASLLAMPPADFEALIGQLLAKIGFEEVSVTDHSGDGGIDVRGTLVVGEVIRTRMAVQVKRWKTNNVQAPIIQQVRGSLGTHDQGLIITTSDFSFGARAEAERPNAVPVALMNGTQLVALLVEHDIGVRRASYDLFELARTPDADDE